MTTYNYEVGRDWAFSHSQPYAKLDPATGGRFFWMSDSGHDLNDPFEDTDPVFYYEIYFRERARSERNLCDISMVWHRDGERSLRGNAGIAKRMDLLAKRLQEEFANYLDEQRLHYARIEESDGNLVVGIRRRLWNIVHKDTGREWSLETAVESVAGNIRFLKQHIEGRMTAIIEDFAVQPARRARDGNEKKAITGHKPAPSTRDPGQSRRFEP
jgi:hypothetical protein